MYAVIRTGSKQYRVSPGDMITVERLEVPKGGKCSFEDVLLYHDGDKVMAAPKELAKVKVTGKIVDQGRSAKTLVFKFKPKKGYHRMKGHRQQLTRVEIEDIIVRKSAPRGKAAAGKASGAASKPASEKESTGGSDV